MTETMAEVPCSIETKMSNIHTTSQLQVVLFKPERFGEDTRAIADELLKIHTVVLNLEETPKRCETPYH